MDKAPSSNLSIGNTGMQKPLGVPKLISQNPFFPVVTNSVPPPSESLVSSGLKKEAAPFVPKNKKNPPSTQVETSKQIPEVKQEEKNENIIKPKSELKTEQDSKKPFLNVKAKEFDPTKSKQPQTAYQAPQKPMNYIDQNYNNKGIPNEYQNQNFYPSMYGSSAYNQMSQNMQPRMNPNMPIMPNQMAQGQYFYQQYPQNYMQQYPPPVQMYNPSMASPHLNLDSQMNVPKKFDNTLPESKPNNEPFSKLRLNKDAESYVAKKKTSENKITEETPNEDKGSLPPSFNRNVEVKNPGKIPNYAAELGSSVPKDKAESDTNLLSSQNKSESINKEKKDNILSSTKIANIITEDKVVVVAKNCLSSELFDIKVQLSQIQDCVYSSEFIYKFLKLEVCKQEVRKIIRTIYTRNEEVSTQRMEERSTFSKGPKPYDNMYKRPQEKITEYSTAIERNQIPEEIKILEEKAKQNLKKTQDTNKTKEIKFEMNRLSVDNYEKIKGNIINLVVSEEDYEILSSIMFKKAWKEKIYANLYAKLCSEIVSASKGGEKKDNAAKDHKLRKLIVDECQKTFENRKNLYNVDPSVKPDEVEEHISRKRKQIFGTIRYTCMLYEKSVISYVIIMKIIHTLLQLDQNVKPDDNDEIELVCEILETCGKKLSESEKKTKFQQKFTEEKQDKAKYAPEITFSETISRLTKIMNGLDAKSRMKYIIMNLLELVGNNWVKVKSDSSSQKENTYSQSVSYTNKYGDDYFEEKDQYSSNYFNKKGSSPSMIQYVPKQVQKNSISKFESQNFPESSFTESCKYDSEEMKDKMTDLLNSSENVSKIKDTLKDINEKGHTFDNFLSSLINAWLSNSLQPSNFEEIIGKFIDISSTENIYPIEEMQNGFNVYLLSTEETFEECPKLIEVMTIILTNFVLKFNLPLSSLYIIPNDPGADTIINNRVKLELKFLKVLQNKGNNDEELIKSEIKKLKKLIKKSPYICEMTLEELFNLITQEDLSKFI